MVITPMLLTTLLFHVASAAILRPETVRTCKATLVPVTRANQTVLDVVDYIYNEAPEETQATWLALCHYNNLTTWERCVRRPPVPIWWGCYNLESVNNRKMQLAIARGIMAEMSDKRVTAEAKKCRDEVMWKTSGVGPHVELCNHVRTC